MKKFFKQSLRLAVCTAVLCAVVLVSASWHKKLELKELVQLTQEDNPKGDPILGVTYLVNTTYAQVDAEAETLIPANRVYSRYDALQLRGTLEAMHDANPSSMAINLALVKFHANAPNFSGGFKGMALQYAADIYRLNSYVGAIAYEYVYYKNHDFKNAERWYKNSLISRLADGMEWREIKYNGPAPFGVGVTGNFNNNRLYPLYQNIWGSYTRKIMVPKCVGNDCTYTVITNFLRNSKQVKGELVFVNW